MRHGELVLQDIAAWATLLCMVSCRCSMLLWLWCDRTSTYSLCDTCRYYPTPKAAASNIKDYVAFWKGVKVGA